MANTTEIHANAGGDFNPRARCGSHLTATMAASAQAGGATNNPDLVTCPKCRSHLRGE